MFLGDVVLTAAEFALFFEGANYAKIAKQQHTPF